MTQRPNGTSPIRPRALIAIALIVALAALTTLHRLGAADVCGSNEAVEAVFLQQMVEHGALLFPLENGRSPMYKPPLFHWTAVAIDRLAGIRKVTAFNLRLPAALYAIAGVILTIAFASAFLGGAGGLLAGLILTASYQYIENARIGRVDMTLCFFETLALFAFAWWFARPAPSPPLTPLLVQREDTHASCVGEGTSPPDAPTTTAHEPLAPLLDLGEVGASEPSERGAGRGQSPTAAVTFDQETSHLPSPWTRRGIDSSFRYLVAIALGLAVLAKGPVGAILPGLAIAIFLVAEKRLRDLSKLATPGPVLLMLAIASSWYLACLFGRRYGFLDRQIASENFGRFFGSLGAMASWYYLKPILLNSAPISLLVPFAVFSALRTYWRRPALEGSLDFANDDSQHLSLSRERSSDLNEVQRPAGEGISSSRTHPPATSALPGEGSPASPVSHQRPRPAQNPLSLWMALRMMFLPKMDTPARQPSRSSPSSAPDLADGDEGASSQDLVDDPQSALSQNLVDDPRRGPSQHLSLSRERSGNVSVASALPGEGTSSPLTPDAANALPGEGTLLPTDARPALSAVRLLAIFWVVTVLFFTVAAYKRRAYLLPLWPASAVMLSWWITSLARSRNGSFLRAAVIATCTVLIATNFYLLPRREFRECAGDSMRAAAAQINRVVGPAEPLYLFQFQDEPAPLLFYLDRTAPRITGKLGDAPPGYVITTAEAWRRLQPQALDLQPVFESSSGRPRLVLLRHGKAYALR